MIEKPFGHDLASARALNRDISKVLDESQVYRIDHYLGKETVQNILALRFGNAIFEPIWNRRHVAVGADHRGRGAGDGRRPRRLLRQLRRAPRHGSKPPDAAPLPGRDGAAGRPLGRRRPERAGQGARRPAAMDGRRRRPQRRPRPVHRRVDRGEGGPRLPPGKGRTARLEDRDLCRAAGDPEQLAVGGRAVLPAHRQAAAEAGQRDRDPVPQAANDALRGRHRGDGRDEPSGPPDPAQRGGKPGLPGEGPCLAAAAPGGPHGFPLRHGVRHPPARSLRAAPARRHARRPDPVYPPPTPSRAPGDSAPRSSTPGPATTPHPCCHTPPEPGGPPRPTP